MELRLRRCLPFLATAALRRSSSGGVGPASASAMTVAPPPPAHGAGPHHNVLLSAAYLMPVGGKLITAHQTRDKVRELLADTLARRDASSAHAAAGERAMIVDISATTWNWDTYAIVAGQPSPVRLVLASRDDLRARVPLDDDDVAQEGLLVPQPADTMVWVPKGAALRESTALDDAADGTARYEFVFEAPVDPNDDRLEHWEQEVRQNHLHKWRAQLVRDSMRSMLQFYDLDRIVCWDLSWGIWEAVRADGGSAASPAMVLRTGDGTTVPFPSDDDDAATQVLYDGARPISPELLEETLGSVAGYYLVGGNTYTMSLFHHMWDQQRDADDGAARGGHMQSLREKLADGTLFYMGHSAGLIMAGPNILTATFKGIDAFSVVTQPYNAPFVRLPPSETPASFFCPDKNRLCQARTQMLRLMRRYDAWRGYRVVEALAFPHYDARPRAASFPQSAATYLRATDARGRFAQAEASLLVEDAATGARAEPADLAALRRDANARGLPCYPVANGHAVVLACGGTDVAVCLSPAEEGAGVLHWDTYMPYVPAGDGRHFIPGRTRYAAGAFTGDEGTLAGDRAADGYRGARIFSRLEALGLPNPGRGNEGEAGRLFRSE